VDCLGSAVLTNNLKGYHAYALGESRASRAMYVVKVSRAVLYELRAVIKNVLVSCSIVAKTLFVVVVLDSLLEDC
jgi:hypothetical protein